MSDEVDFVITDKKWNKEFDEVRFFLKITRLGNEFEIFILFHKKGLKENSKLKFVESTWLNACNRRKKLLPYEPFEIVADV